MQFRLYVSTYADRETFVRGEPNLISFIFSHFFLVDEGIIEDPNIIINGPSSDRQQNAIHMAFP